VIVGVNEYEMDEKPHPILYIDEQVADEQVARVQALRASRDQAKFASAIASLKDAARGSDNLMPAILEASRAYATVGEMCDALREVFGEYEEQPVFCFHPVTGGWGGEAPQIRKAGNRLLARLLLKSHPDGRRRSLPTS
jgi:hypothetical protein